MSGYYDDLEESGVNDNGSIQDEVKSVYEVGEVQSDFEQPDTDLFKSIQKFSRQMGDTFASHTYGLNSRATNLLSKAAERQIDIASSNYSSFQRKRFESERLLRRPQQAISGFYSRPGVEEYTNLMRGQDFKGTYFQFQETNVMSSLLTSRSSWEVATQSLQFKNVYGSSKEGFKSTASILMPNELSIRSTELLKTIDKDFKGSVVGVQSLGSFHPKVGATRDYAFIGTQNITTALQRKGSIESLLVFERNNKSSINKLFESSVAEELDIFARTTIDIAKQNAGRMLRPGQLTTALGKNGNRHHVYVNNEILSRITGALEQAASSGDRVVMSMGEMSLLMSKDSSDSKVISVKRSLESLAKSGRLSVVTEAKNLSKVISNPNTDKSLLSTLTSTGSIRSAVTGFHHEKGVAIYGNDNDLQFLSLGSANFSSLAMLPISQLDNKTQQLIKNTFGNLTREELSDTINTEAVVAIGRGRYSDATRQRQAGTDEYLAGLDTSHFNKIAGIQNRYFTGYYSERTSDSQRILGLKAQLLELNRTLGYDLVNVEDRYNVDYSKSTNISGLRVTVKGMDKAHRVNLDLTVNKAGDVIISDYNKIISGSLFVNKDRSSKNIFGRLVGSGESIRLSPEETALGVVTTLARTFNYQSRYGLVNDAYSKLISKDKQLQYATRSINRITGEIARSLKPGLGAVEGETNLTSLVKHLGNQDDVRSLAEGIVYKLATGEYSSNPFKRTFDSDQIAARFKLLSTAIPALSNKMLMQYDLSVKSFGVQIAKSLATDTDGLLSDLKYLIVNDDPASRDSISRAASTQSRVALSDILSPFLAGHEQGYSGYQTKTRLPVYGEGFLEDKTSMYGRTVDKGILNPLAVRHGTRLGAAGQYLSTVGAVTSASRLKLPGYGGLSQLRVIDTNLSTGAVAVDELSTLSRSLPGMTQITKESLSSDISKVLSVMGSSRLTSEEQAQLDERMDVLLTTALYNVSFPKAEQIPQRLKNLKGARPALEINNAFARAARNLDLTSIKDNLTPSEFISSTVKSSLPAEQYQELHKVYQELSSRGPVSKTDLDNYFRNMESNPLETRRGFLGGRMKRVAIQAGMHLMSDFSYGNAGYEYNVGSTNLMRVKVHRDKLSSPVNTIDLLANVFKPGSLAIPNSVALDPHSNELQVIKEKLNYDLETQRDYFIKGDTVYRKEGLYTPTEQGYKRIGEYTEGGLIRVFDLETVMPSHLGKQYGSIDIKMGFTKRHEQGFEIVTDIPNITETATGTLLAEIPTLTVRTPGTGSRVVGGGLAKGPVSYVKEDLFNAAENILSNLRSGGKSYKDFIPSSIANDKIFEMRSFSLFKGYNFETGMYLLSEADSRQALMNVDRKELARSLSILFMKDKEVKEALQMSLRQDGLYQASAAVGLTKGFDVSAINENQTTQLVKAGLAEQGSSLFGQIGIGLASLGNVEGVIKQDLGSVKQLVTQALRGDELALNQLQERTRNLFSKVVSDSSIAGSVVFDESLGINKGAGLIAHMLFLNRQLFVDSVGAGFNGSLLESSLDDVQRYQTDVSYKIYVDMMASSAGLSLEGLNQQALIERLRVLQSTLGSGFTMENLVDLGISRSLVPSGMQDSVKMEYQYLLGTTSQYWKAFTSGAPEEALKYQMTYKVLAAVASGQRIGSMQASDDQLSYRIALKSDRDGFLTRQDIDIRRLALSGSTVLDGLIEKTTQYISETGRGGKDLNRLEQIRRISTGISRSIDDRVIAENLNRYGLPYFSGETREFAADALHKDMLDWQKDNDLKKQSLRLTSSFKDYLDTNTNARVHSIAAAPSELIRNIDSGIQSKEDIFKYLDKLNTRSLEKVRAARSKGMTDLYVENLSKIEETAKSLGKSDLARDVRQTKQIILPSFDMIPTDKGYRISMRSPSEQSPTVGLLLGTDILKNSALVFGDYKDDILTKQVELSSALIESKSLLQKVASTGSDTYLNAHEAERMQQLQQLIETSGASINKLLETDLVRKAFGDHESYKGAVGIAVSSFALAPDQIALGSRYESLGGENQLKKVLDNQISLTLNASPADYEQRLAQLTELYSQVVGDESSVDTLTKRNIQPVVDALRQEENIDREKALKAHIYSDITDLSQERILQLESNEPGRDQLKKLIGLSIGGGVRRSGAPAGMSGMVSGDGNLNYAAMAAEAYNNMVSTQTNQSSLMLVDAQRFSTGMMLPAVSRLLAGLGDYDGDAYQLIFSRYGESANTLKKAQQELLELERKREKIERLVAKRKANGFNDAYDLELQAELSKVRESIRVHNFQVNDSIDELNNYRIRNEKLGNRALKDVRSWAKTFLSLPNSLTGDYKQGGGISTGTMISLVSQKFSIDGVSDAAPYIQDAERNIQLFGKLFDTTAGGFEYSAAALEESNIPKYVGWLSEQQSNYKREELEDKVRNVIGYAKDRVGGDSASYKQVMTEYFSSTANLAMAMENVGGTLKKASGTTLNAFEFQSMQSLIGRGGTDLIGKTYNAFIPLLDQAGIEISLANALKNNPNMQQTLGESLGTDSPLYKKLVSPEFNQSVVKRFEGVTSVLGSMQQLIRDALKAKEGGALTTILNKEVETKFGVMNLGNALDMLPEDMSPIEADKYRIDLLRSTLNTTLGPIIKTNIDRNPLLGGSSGASDLLRQTHNDPGVTGFGALIEFADYIATKDEDIESKFIERLELQSEYQNAVQTGKVKSANEFVAKNMLDLIERTQASYLADTISDTVRGTLIDNAVDFKAHIDANNSVSQLEEWDKVRYNLVDDYVRLRDTDGIDRVQLDKALVEESILSQIKEQNKVTNVLTPEHLQDLREISRGTDILRMGIDSSTYDSMANRMELGNELTYNSYIRRMRRGQHLDATEAMYAAGFKFNYIDNMMDELGLEGIHGNKAKEQALFLAGLKPFQGGVLSGDENTELVRGLLTETNGGTAYDQLRNTTAIANKMTGYLEMISDAESNPNVSTQAEIKRMTQDMQQLWDSRTVNTEQLNLLRQRTTPDQSKARVVMEGLNDLTESTVNKSQHEPFNLKHNSSLEIAGALASPLLIALASSGLPLDERVGMFGMDALQALAQNANSINTYTRNFVGDGNAARSYQAGRVRESLENEGYFIGGLQGAGQEMLFKGISELSHNVLDKVVGGRSNTRSIGGAVGLVGAELLSTILAQSAARAITQRKIAQNGAMLPDFTSRLIGDFIEKVWQMAEQAQLQLLSPDYEVIDTDENMRMDFDTSAIPSEMEWDLETGFVVLDQGGDKLAVEIDSSNSERSQSMRSVNSFS